MTRQDLIAAFETLADAPDGVTRLRELVLQLAVRGKLVPQDANDEPARVLLERIAEEKARLVNAGKIRKPKLLPPIGEEIPFEVPDGWTWVRFAELTDSRLGKMLDKSKNSGPFRPYVRNTNLQWFRFELEDLKELRLEDSELDECTLQIGDLAITEGGEPGRCAVVDEASAGLVYQKAIHRARPVGGCNPWYLAYLLRVDTWSGRLAQLFTGATIKHLTGRSLAQYTVPLPPLAEQHRIVARVDELMGLLDRLEAARDARDATRAALRDAALAELRDADDAETVQVAWARIAEHMDDLFTHPDDVAPLRQAILQLAVRGRLVPQDSDDEPAGVLLERIAEEKARLVKEGKIRKPKLLPPIGEDDVPFEVPAGWEWARLAELCTKITDGAHQKPTYVEQGVPFISVKDVSSGTLSFEDCRYISSEEHARIYARCDTVRDDILLTKVGTTGVAVVVDTDVKFSLFVSVALLKHLTSCTVPRYLRWAIESPVVKSQSSSGTEGVGNKNLVLRKIRAFAIPLAPLAEQHRIVARVDELVEVCDRLKEKLTGVVKTQAKFASAAVHHLEA